MVIKIKNEKEFKTALLVKGFTQRGLAREIGISEVYSNQIVNGARNPGPEIAKKICLALEAKFEDIFFIEDACNSYQNTGTT